MEMDDTLDTIEIYHDVDYSNSSGTYYAHYLQIAPTNYVRTMKTTFLAVDTSALTFIKIATYGTASITICYYIVGALNSGTTGYRAAAINITVAAGQVLDLTH